MSESKLVTGLGQVDETWGAALKESGLRYQLAESGEAALKSSPDFLLLDFRSGEDFKKLALNGKTPVLSLVGENPSLEELRKLRDQGIFEYASVSTPPEEIVLRIRSMLLKAQHGNTGESRSAKRVWFQQNVNFRVFDKKYTAWSTTLSETGIFIRTDLSFPLYSTMHLSFKLWGDEVPFECDAVIVRQEGENDPKGLGVMFQNLRGENIRRLESFFEIYRREQ